MYKLQTTGFNSLFLPISFHCLQITKSFSVSEIYVILSFRSKTYLFEEFLSSWYEKLKEREATTMTVRLHKDIEKYKV